MDWDSSELRQYLLGALPAEEMSKLDLQILSDPEFTTAIEVEEEELIDDYLDGMLAADQLRRFEYYFLSSPQRREQIEASRGLKHIAKRELGEKALDQLQKNERPGNLTRMRSNYLLLPRLNWATVGIAACLLIAIGFAYWILRHRGGGAPDFEDSQLTQLNQRDLSDLSQYAALARLTLIPGVTRDSTELQKLSLRNAPELILIRLAMPSDVTAETVRVRISHNNLPIASLANIKVYKTKVGQDVRLLLPKERLTVGTYMLEIVNNHSATAGATYTFEVES